MRSNGAPWYCEKTKSHLRRWRATTTDIGAHLHHQKNRVEDDERHYEVLERSGLDDSPQSVPHANSLLGHVPFQGRRVDGEVDAGLLQIH